MQLFVFYTTCLVDGWLGLFFLALDYLSYAFLFYISGYAIAHNSIYYSFLLGYLYLLGWFIFWTLSTQFPEPQPLCNFVDPAALVAFRGRGWPSLDILLLTLTIGFLLGKQMLGEGGLPVKLQFCLLVLFPFWVIGDVVSRNATIGQMVAGLLIGALVSGFLVVVFHFVAREYYRSLYALPLVGPLLVDPISPAQYRDKEEDRAPVDHDILMLFPAHKSTSL